METTPTFAGTQFSWTRSVDSRIAVGTTEASVLGIPAGPVIHWPDTFFVWSHRTGDRRLFVRSQPIRDMKGDVIAVVYEGGGVDIHVIND